MRKISDFSEQEIEVVQKVVDERWPDAGVEVAAVDAELRLSPDDRETTTRPGLYWENQGCHFMVTKVYENKTLARERFRCQFFYRVHQHFGTGHDEYDDLMTCVVTLLQVQADHELQENMV